MDGTSYDMSAVHPAAPPTRREKLALLYQGIFTAIVRVQSGRQPLIDANAFQRRMEGLFSEIEREAIKVGYRDKEIDDARYALVAFLDETIQRSDDPNRGAWSPLQSKLYAQAVAGEGVFDRLKTIRTRRDSPDLSDVLEIYYLCFLLGYGPTRSRNMKTGKPDGRPARANEHMRGPGLRSRRRFSVTAQVVVTPPGSPVARGMAAIGCAALTIFGWIIFKLLLNSNAQGVVSDIMAPDRRCHHRQAP
jgi:type IV/VI secretion system ImpK/VasF family protein